MEKTAFVIVTYNSENSIGDCLRSIENFPGNIVVFDNNSEDQTLKLVKPSKKLTLFTSGSNKGFSYGCNAGASQAQAEIVIFLNPDCKVISKDFIKKILEDFEEESVGIVGPKFIHPDGSLQKTVRKFPTVWGAFKEYVLGQKGEYDFYEVKQKSDVDSVVGGCLAIRYDLFKKIGGFNMKYFLYYEDIELCKKIRESKFKIIYDPDILVEHIEGASGKNKPVSRYLIESAKKYHGVLGYYLITLVIKVGQKIHG